MINCTACGYDKNPDDAEYCDACGSELQAVVPAVTSGTAPSVIQPSPLPIEPLIISSPIPQPTYSTPAPSPTYSSTTATSAKLISKQAGSPVPEFTLDSNAVVGVFDPDMGPVDIDLEEFSGGETVSRSHGEIYPEGGVWKIKDLGSTNGIFIKRTGQTRFGARITVPETINTGDEIAFGKVRFLFQSA
ncbi:FHA domain containing protein [Calothrix sp. PCC 7716]|nr:FHA domain containing protein [Calothrix sp. PCC 7716]